MNVESSRSYLANKKYSSNFRHQSNSTPQLNYFPPELVLVGRATVLIKGLSARLNIPWSLASEWAPIAERVIAQSENLPVKLFRSVKRKRTAVKRFIYNRVVTRMPVHVRRMFARLVLAVQAKGGAT